MFDGLAFCGVHGFDSLVGEAPLVGIETSKTRCLRIPTSSRLLDPVSPFFQPPRKRPGIGLQAISASVPTNN